jgi:hypothetical protein
LRRWRRSKWITAHVPGLLYQRCAREVVSFQFVR